MTISRTIRTARKEHQCEECRAVIECGERYARLYGRAESSDPPYEIKLCLKCDNWYQNRRQARQGEEGKPGGNHGKIGSDKESKSN